MQGIAKLGGGLETFVWVLGQPPAHDGFECLRNVLGVLVEALQPTVAHHEQNVEIVLRGKQTLAHEHLGQHDGHGEKVATTVQYRAGDLFRRHVAVLAFECSGLGLGFSLLRVGDAKVP